MKILIALALGAAAAIGTPAAAQCYNCAPPPEAVQATKTCTSVALLFVRCKPSKFIVAPDGSLVFYDGKNPPVVVTKALPTNPNTEVVSAGGTYRTGTAAVPRSQPYGYGAAPHCINGDCFAH